MPEGEHLPWLELNRTAGEYATARPAELTEGNSEQDKWAATRIPSRTLSGALRPRFPGRPRFLGKCEDSKTLLLIEPQICAAYSIPELYKT